MIFLDVLLQAADTQVVSDYVRYFLNQHTIQLGKEATVKTAANLVKELAYQNKSFLQAGMIVAGWDKYDGGSVYGIPLGGTLLRLPFSSGGSGSSYLYGFLDQAWRPNMSKDEAEVYCLFLILCELHLITEQCLHCLQNPRIQACKCGIKQQ
jgi:20S proteasome alpha/beta subunit